MQSCRRLQMMALQALALGMPDIPPDFFEEFHTEADNQLRLLHCKFLQVASGLM